MARRRGSLVVASRLQDDIDRALARAGELPEAGSSGGEATPPMDVVESETSILVLLEVPGLSAGDLRIEACGSRISITGSRPEHPAGEKPVRFFCMERGRGDFERIVELAGAADSHRASARLSRGVLRIEIPKIAERRLEPKAIAITAEE